MTDERGFTLLELLVAGLGLSVVLLGLSFGYVATTSVLDHSAAQAELQRHGTLVLEQMARRIQTASTFSTVVCANGANTIEVNTPPNTYRYCPGDAGQLCEYANGSGTCRDLLLRPGSLRPIALLRQKQPPEPLCPAGVAAGSYCLQVTQSGQRVDITFTLADSDVAAGAAPRLAAGPGGYFRSPTAMVFSTTVTCVGRMCAGL